MARCMVAYPETLTPVLGVRGDHEKLRGLTAEAQRRVKEPPQPTSRCSFRTLSGSREVASIRPKFPEAHGFDPKGQRAAIACITRPSQPAQKLKIRRLCAIGSASFRSTA
jgi:hypothetical protein